MQPKETSFMAIESITLPYKNIKQLPGILQRYSECDPTLQPFITNFPDPQAIQEQIQKKQVAFDSSARKLLVQVLQEQTGVSPTIAQQRNLDWLSHNKTFTVSCGHQLNIAGGPVYMAYKILTVLKLTEQLNREYPDFHFVPVHWLASEDHDLEEILSISFFGQKIKFDIDQTGATGRMRTGNLAGQMKSIRDFPAWMVKAYEDSTTLSVATRAWLQTAFGEKGLLVIDADHKTLKEAFVSMATREIDQPWVEREVVISTKALEANGVKSQIHPRPINLFYLTDKERLRLEEADGKLKTVGGNFEWGKKEGINHFKENPQTLSPNVAFRPVYSQLVLPDIAFVGGPAEIAYWLQLSGVFRESGIPMPLLIPRFSAAFVNQALSKKMSRLGLKANDLLKEDQELKKEATGINTEITLPDLEAVYQKLLMLAQEVDPTLVPMAKSELSKAAKIAEGIQKRISKAAEQKNETRINQILALVRKLFPEGTLQERTESWLSFVAADPEWLDKVYSQIKPLQFSFNILIDREDNV